MVNVDSTLNDLNSYLKKPLSIEQLRETLFKMGFDLDSDSDDSDALKMDITADRPDLISTAGVARALNAYLGHQKGIPKVDVKRQSAYQLVVEKSVQPVRPFTAAFVVKNIHLTEEMVKEIIWVQEKIHDTFARQRKKAAIGIYPLKKIHWPIKFTGEAPEKIKFVPLGAKEEMSGSELLQKHPTGQKYAHLLRHHSIYPVFRDAKGNVLSMPPIINSRDVGQVALDDHDLFVEVSGHYWPTLSTIADILAHLFFDMKGDVYSVEVKYPDEKSPRVTPELGRQSFALDVELVNNTLGTPFTAEQISELLSRMMYDVPKMNPKQLTVEAPSFRADLLHPLDVVDDVARAYGFENLKPIPVELYTRGGVLPQTQFNEDVRDCMAGLGFHEVMTWTLTSHEHHFTVFEREETPHVRLGVVKEQGLTMVRNMLYPETIRALLANRSQPQPFRLFELDQIVDIHEPEDTGTKTHYKLCMILGHASATFDEMKGNVDALGRFLGSTAVFSPVEMSGFISGRTAHVKMGQLNGFAGEMHPRVLNRLGIPFPLLVFECYLTH
jgi:phenylalanyl-tRNA synthetase beta chain